MTNERFELAESSIKYNSDANLTMGSDESRKRVGGCFLSFPLAFVLLLLALLIAVGVGLIVHFASAGETHVVCEWSGVASQLSTAALTGECEKLVQDGQAAGVCSKCHEDPSTAVTQPPGGEAADASKKDNVRLPLAVLPVHYVVELMPQFFTEDPKDFKYTGSVEITVTCVESTAIVTLHAKHLVVDTSTIKIKGVSPNADDLSFNRMDIDEAREFIKLTFSKNLEPGNNYTISMSYSAVLDNDLHGLYYSSYKRGNETVYMVTTQFQPTDARRVFPCFDEPALKATFKITLVRPTHLISISNTPIADNSTTFQQDDLTFVKDVYEVTPKMSTYLLAFIVCDFKYLSRYTENDVLYRAWATPETVNQANYSLDVGVKVLTYFEDFFNISYPLPKQDMIAIPDFAAGAMENWGLITYRETAMLYEPGVSNEANRERIAIVVSHELAHQWFGDLVSPAWWDELWLNEGFATFVEYLGVDFVHPDWNVFETFALTEIQGAFYFDGLISSHPLYVPVGHPDEINEIFDTISYAKGASIIRMMRHFLGEETFKKGLTNYLNSRAYDVAVHDDLWSALTEQAKRDGKGHLDVKSVMDTWTLQMNYPVVTVIRDFQNHKELHIRQDRYLMDPNAKDPQKYTSPYNYRWTIPLTFSSSKTLKSDHTDKDVYWLDREHESTTVSLTGDELPDRDDKNGWILANINQNGFYRVNYQLGNWDALVRQLEKDHTVIPPINRAQIIDDAWNLAKAGHLPLNYALNTLDYIDKERAHIPWSASSSQISYVSKMLSLTPAYGAFRSFMKAKLMDPFKAFGMNNTGSSHVDITARRLVVRLACVYEVENCSEEAHKQFKEWMVKPNNNKIDVELRSTIYCRAIHEGGWEEWSFALRMYKESNVASEKIKLLSAMGCSKTPWILNHFLNIVLEKDSPIRKQDALTVINQVSGSTIGRPLAWRFFMANYDRLLKDFGKSFFSWTRLIGRITARFNTEFDYQELKQFRDSKADKLGTGERAFEQALEKTRTNIKWMSTNYEIIAKWLGDQNFPVAGA